MDTVTDIAINRSMRIIKSTGKLQVTKSFAESNLSSSALKYANKTDTHYLWDWGTTSYIVVYELPSLFNIAFPEVMRFLINYCLDYLKENKITDSVIYTRFLDNSKKRIVR